jgi:UDP-N-acetylmuramate--alanine ligase
VVGHDEANLPEGEDVEVVRSSAIGSENPELRRAVAEGLRVVHRGELLAELCGEKRLIAVAGTHGKTTTTAMAVWILRQLGADPAFFVGGEAAGLGAGGEAVNAGWGAGEWVIAEADESDASFLELRPEIAVVTNVEMDHHARWSSIQELRAAFEEFTRGAKVADFDAESPGPAELDLSVPGRHNLLNARAALAVVGLAGFDLEQAAAALTGFPGVRRRLELKGERDGARVYDDYAHHPTEVRAALAALRELDGDRLVVVFQPHLYSRTRAFAEEFGAALSLADEAVVLDVYPAREEPVGELEGVSGLLVARAAADRMSGRPVVWAPTMERALEAAERRLLPGAILVTVGAGDVFVVGERLLASGGEG